jgi:hypothetical protein
MKDICFATFARNERDRLPVWLKHYQQFADNSDIYVIDQNTTDGSTEGLPCNVIYEPNKLVFDHAWLRQMLTDNIRTLLQRYRVVVMTECDELIITRDNVKLDEYLVVKYGSMKLIDIVQHDDEPTYNINEQISKKRHFIFDWDDQVKHLIHTYCNNEIQSGFHGGDGIIDDNLTVFHTQFLNKKWYIDKIRMIINLKDQYGQGDNYQCWEDRYLEHKIDDNLHYIYSKLQRAPDYFTNNYYI